ncbi:MAG: hypothetical protein LGB54_02555 [Sulfurovum sp.]|nr:hypothetical protein [Sulfurovum sp.]MCB4759246.1 hypothetical protein [Sulfurovum sp.]MCB4782564.1 hypothetical protein [Sulfurovum sp.]
MDKSFIVATTLHARRRAFALFLTLSILAVIIALTGVLVGYLDTARKDASSTKALIQANLYFANIKKTFSRLKKREILYNTLYLGPIPLQSEDGRFSLLFSCHPMDNGININWLGMESKSLMQKQYNAAQQVLEVLALEYELSNPERLEEMIDESVHPKETFSYQTQSRMEQKNGIVSYQQFEAILNRYQFETDDPNVGKVPWKKYFVFHPTSKAPEENRIAGDYLSAKLLSILFNIDSAILSEDWVKTEGAFRILLGRYGITYDKILFADTFIDRSFCKVSYTYQKENYVFSFVDIQGEVKDFVFYGKQ